MWEVNLKLYIDIRVNLLYKALNIFKYRLSANMLKLYRCERLHGLYSYMLHYYNDPTDDIIVQSQKMSTQIICLLSISLFSPSYQWIALYLSTDCWQCRLLSLKHWSNQIHRKYWYHIVYLNFNVVLTFSQIILYWVKTVLIWTQDMQFTSVNVYVPQWPGISRSVVVINIFSSSKGMMTSASVLGSFLSILFINNIFELLAYRELLMNFDGL